MLVVSLCDLTSLMVLRCCRTVEPTHHVLVIQLSDAFEKMVLHLSSPTRHINFYDFFTMKMSSWRSGTYMSLVSHCYTKLMPSRPRLIPSEDQVLLSEAGTPSWCRGDISRRQPASHLHSLETTQLLEVATFFCKRYVEKHIWTQWFVSYRILVESWQLHHPRWTEAL